MDYELPGMLARANEHIERLAARVSVLEKALTAQKAVPPSQQKALVVSQAERDAMAQAAVAYIERRLAPLRSALEALESRSADAEDVRELAAAVRAIRPAAENSQTPRTRNYANAN